MKFDKANNFADMDQFRKVLLIILDGWGIGKGDYSDAIASAKTPFIDSLSQQGPMSKLKTFGNNVGLPEGQMGNSEVGHMNIGAGRVVWQMLPRISSVIDKEELHLNVQWQDLLHTAHRHPGKNIHLMGLVSDGGVHSSIDHLLGICRELQSSKLDNRTFVHAFTDGRDTDPHSSEKFIKSFLDAKERGSCALSSIIGRYYAMDRDKRWERTKKAYDLLVNREGTVCDSALEAIEKSYRKGLSDEFLEPLIIGQQPGIAEGDIVLFFNFRTDRGRQLVETLTQKSMHEFNMHTLPLEFYTLTNYNPIYSGIKVLFEEADLQLSLGEYLSIHHKSQLRAAETEKYPHVTFFFNGGREEPFDGEERILVNSPKVSTYDLQPEMSAAPLSTEVTQFMYDKRPDFICINYANPDMVGHTGVFEAIVKACETVDQHVEELVINARKQGYEIMIIADHGNAEKAVNEDGSPHTAHTTNLVPCYVLTERKRELKDGKLADVAATILDLMGLAKPDLMTGESLIIKE